MPLFQIKCEKRKGNFSPEEIYSIFLKKIKQISSNYLGKEVKDALITVPCHFNLFQRKSIENAGKIADLNILRIITDSTSASLYYTFKNNQSIAEKKILIFDLGGSSFNVALANIEDGLSEILVNEGIVNLGGENFNNRLIEYCAKEYEKKTSIDISSSPTYFGKLRLLCEKAKIALSSDNQTTIEIYDIFSGEKVKISITREIFENICKDLFEKCIKHLKSYSKMQKWTKMK